MKRCKACEGFFESMNYKYEYCNECYDKMCKEAVEKMKEMDKQTDIDKKLEQINTICEMELHHLREIKDKIHPDGYEVMCTHMEIIQDIISKIKNRKV